MHEGFPKIHVVCGWPLENYNKVKTTHDVQKIIKIKSRPNQTFRYRRTQKFTHTLLLKHSKDLLERYSSERGKDEVSYFYAEDVFCIHLGTKYANFQENIFPETSGKRFQTFHCSNVTAMKNLELSPRNLR